MVESDGLLTLTANGIPDHNAWVLENNSALTESEVTVRFPTVPTLLENGQYTVSNDGAVGFALNGVDIYSGYDMDTCCDFAIQKYDFTDYCTGYASSTFPSYGRYHYHFYPTSTAGYDGCLMETCSMSEVSPVVGVAKDGFPIYGPVQLYSASEGKIYINENNCGDCVLTRMHTNILDDCNGIEVADGDVTKGNVYRYLLPGVA